MTDGQRRFAEMAPDLPAGVDVTNPHNWLRTVVLTIREMEDEWYRASIGPEPRMEGHYKSLVATVYRLGQALGHLPTGLDRPAHRAGATRREG